VVAGVVSLANNPVTTKANPGYEITMRNILQGDNYRNGKPVKLAVDPQGWFDALPHEYTGSMVRARMIWEDE